jgi:hypothetical protein
MPRPPCCWCANPKGGAELAPTPMAVGGGGRPATRSTPEVVESPIPLRPGWGLPLEGPSSALLRGSFGRLNQIRTRSALRGMPHTGPGSEDVPKGPGALNRSAPALRTVSRFSRSLCRDGVFCCGPDSKPLRSTGRVSRSHPIAKEADVHPESIGTPAAGSIPGLVKIATEANVRTRPRRVSPARGATTAKGVGWSRPGERGIVLRGDATEMAGWAGGTHPTTGRTMRQLGGGSGRRGLGIQNPGFRTRASGADTKPGWAASIQTLGRAPGLSRSDGCWSECKE